MNKNLSIHWVHPVKCFNNFVQSAVKARRQKDENPISCVFAETMRLLTNSSYGFQTMDRSRHSFTKFTNDEKTHAAIHKKLFNRLGQTNDQLHEVELAQSEIEHKGLIFVGFFILQEANWEALLHLLHKLLRYWQVWGDRNGYRFTVFSASRKTIVC